MCGIAGLFELNNDIQSSLNTMLDSIQKRGPDGDGKYLFGNLGMGMRRLSIIDLEGGDQPLFSDENKIVAFQNGEIYNYKELTRELQKLGYKFVSQSDTEVLAHGYSAWGGRKLLQKLDGMFGLAIFDKKENKLFLARDRFGEKPVYYALDKNNKKFAYCSDARSLSRLQWVGKQLSRSALSRYLMLGFTTGDQSIFHSVKKLPPAHYITLDMDTFATELSCYYVPNMDEGEFTHNNVNEIKDSLEEKIKASVELRLQADVPVGIFLSGGIDSSIIAAISAKKNPNINTFSIGFSSDKYDESKYAQEVAKHIGSAHHHFMFDETSFVDLLPKIIGELDEPLADQASLPTFWLSKEARKYVTVVLSGEGGDEVFGGYSYYEPFLKNQNTNSLLFNSYTSLSGFPLLLSKENCIKFMPSAELELTSYESNLFNFILTARSSLQMAMAADLMVWLPDDLLVKLDRMAMANSLEGRAPYLSHHIVDFCYGLKDVHKIKNNEFKLLLRKVGENYLPASIFNRPKQGFVLPMDDWIKRWFKQESAESFFKNRIINELDTKGIIRYAQNEIGNPVFNQRLLFSLIVLYEWAQFNDATECA